MVGTGTQVPSPNQVHALARMQIARQFAKAPHVLHEAQRQVQPPTRNADGTWTHHVMVGYSKGLIDLMRFFPRHVNVRPGDTVDWRWAPSNRAPHTVTFLNGQPEPDLVALVDQPSGPPVAYVDPGTLFPSLPTADLTRTGLYSSGLVVPAPGAGWSIKIGDVSAGAAALHLPAARRQRHVGRPGGAAALSERGRPAASAAGRPQPRPTGAARPDAAGPAGPTACRRPARPPSRRRRGRPRRLPWPPWRRRPAPPGAPSPPGSCPC